MNIQLHKNARTTPAIRLELQSQPESVSDRELAEAYPSTVTRLRNGANARGWKMLRTAQRLHATLRHGPGGGGGGLA